MDAEERLAADVGVAVSLHTTNVGAAVVRFARAGSGRPLVLLHGATIGWGQWFPNIAFFAKYFSVYAVDIPGAGGSSTVDFFSANVETSVVDVLARFLQQHGLIDAILVGHSWGAWIALRLAARADLQVSRLLLLAPVGFSSAMPWRYRLLSNKIIVHLLTRTVMRPTVPHMRAFLQSVLARATPVPEALAEVLATRVAAARSRHPFFLIHRMSGFFSVRKEFLFDRTIEQVRCPVLVIVGDKDPLLQNLHTAQVRDVLPQAQVEWLRGVGHVPALEQPDLFHRLGLSFLVAT
jgi:pimeloyl-ACP methyl ester carboxylesterase